MKGLSGLQRLHLIVQPRLQSQSIHRAPRTSRLHRLSLRRLNCLGRILHHRLRPPRMAGRRRAIPHRPRQDTPLLVMARRW